MTRESIPAFAAHEDRYAFVSTARPGAETLILRAPPDDAGAHKHSESESNHSPGGCHPYAGPSRAGSALRSEPNPRLAQPAIVHTGRSQDCRTRAILPRMEFRPHAPEQCSSRSIRIPTEAGGHASNHHPTFPPA